MYYKAIHIPKYVLPRFSLPSGVVWLLENMVMSGLSELASLSSGIAFPQYPSPLPI